MKEQIIRILENRATKFQSINHSFEAREVRSAIDTIKRLVPPELFAIHIVSNCVDDLEYSLYKQVVNLKEKVNKLEFMIENGLGEEDMINDITYPSGD